MRLTTLATAADLGYRIGRDLLPAEMVRVKGLLADASSSVRNYCTQDFTESTSTVRLKIRRNQVRLPQRPVTAVTAVTFGNAGPLGGGSPAPFRWEGFDTLWVARNVLDSFGWEPFLNGITAVDVTYTHGYPDIPDDIIGVVCSIVARALGRDPLDAGMVSETIATYSYTLGSAAAGGGFGMLPAERSVLDTYKRAGSRIMSSPDGGEFGP